LTGSLAIMLSAVTNIQALFTLEILQFRYKTMLYYFEILLEHLTKSRKIYLLLLI